jgi:hypothetical protein
MCDKILGYFVIWLVSYVFIYGYLFPVAHFVLPGLF